jgi:CelD/BcsL family acetyltransferase involved in cellulose biosynthesis
MHTLIDPVTQVPREHRRPATLGQRLRVVLPAAAPPRARTIRVAPLAVTEADGVDGLRRFAADLDRLNAASARPSPFCSSAFLIAYARNCEYHPAGVPVRLFLVQDEGRIIAALPLRRVLDGYGEIAGWPIAREPRLELLATHDCDQLSMLCAKADEQRVARALIGHLTARGGGWGILELIGQRPGGALHRAAHEAASWTHRVRDIRVDTITEIALTWPDLAAYFRSLSKHMRSNVSRQARRLYAAGEVVLVLADGPGAVAPWLEAYRDLDGRSWKAGTASSIDRHPVRTAFFGEVVEGRAGVEPSFIGVVLDGVLVAGLFVASNRAASPTWHGAWCLEMAYDRAYAALGPGNLLLLLATAEAIARRDAFLNFMQNFTYFKHRWGATEIPVANVQLIRRLSLHNVRATAGDARRWWLARVGSRPSAPPSGHPPQLARKTEPDGAGDGTIPSTGGLPCRDRAEGLTRIALRTNHPGLRRLGGDAAQAYLPFPIDLQCRRTR